MSEWKEYKLGEVSEFSQGIQVPVEEQKNFSFDGGVRFIRIVDFTNNDIKDIRYIPDPGSKYLVEKDDLVMIRYGSQTAGKIARGFRGVIANNTFKITPDETILDKGYLFYFLSQKRIYDFFRSSQSSSAMPAITFGQVGDLKIKVPPINIQIVIANILSSLDDKIELNNKINQELESLTQLLFKLWFVDFEFPNEKGEPYKLSGGQMIESELGEIPKGWEAFKLGDIINHQTLKVKKIQETVTNVYSAVKTSELVLSDEYFNKQVYSKSIENYYVVEPYWFAYNPSRINIGSIGLNKAKTGAVSPVYVVFNVKHNLHFILENYFKLSSIKNQIIQKCSGTVRQSLNFDSLSTFPFVKSPDNIINRFNEYIEMYYDVSKQLKEENDSLIKLREELLPKFISGELQINDN
jgi:type I restriction enzyme S subunit